MRRVKKRNLLFLVILLVFAASYARHRHLNRLIDITGRLQDKRIDEASGIAASGIFNDVYYVHNDSGDTSRVFSITPDGKLKNIIYYNGDPAEKLAVHDVEDIAVGPGPDAKTSYIYMGDIGDNKAVRKTVTIYRIQEQKNWKDSVIHAAAEPLHLTYPNGPQDAETLMVDPIGKLFYIVSKRQDTVRIYTTPLNFKAGENRVLSFRGKMFFPGIIPLKWITAGDISRDGHQILLKNYQKVYYWSRTGDEPVWQTMMRPPRPLSYQPEKQGEAIGFTLDGRGYYTTSEGVFSPIYYYNLP
jgi:hypothetical protein